MKYGIPLNHKDFRHDGKNEPLEPPSSKDGLKIPALEETCQGLDVYSMEDSVVSPTNLIDIVER